MDALPPTLPVGRLPGAAAAERPQDDGAAGRDVTGAEIAVAPPALPATSAADAGESVLPRSPTALDRAVGRRIRERRVALGMPLQLLSRRIGVSGPQLQRYEMGHTRIAAGRLIAIADALDISVETLAGSPPQERPQAAEDAELLLSAFRAIICPARRRALVALARSMAMDGVQPRR